MTESMPLYFKFVITPLWSSKEFSSIVMKDTFKSSASTARFFLSFPHQEAREQKYILSTGFSHIPPQFCECRSRDPSRDAEVETKHNASLDGCFLDCYVYEHTAAIISNSL